jgi:hypothetical protein
MPGLSRHGIDIRNCPKDAPATDKFTTVIALTYGPGEKPSPPAGVLASVARMVLVRRGEADADLESFRRVRLAVVPHERALTVAEMRAACCSTTPRRWASITS